MPRPVWSGMITFGLVNIPVKLFNCIKRAPIHFHQLRKSDGCRIAYKKVCADDGSEISAGEIVRGFEVSPDRHVMISEEELDSLYPKATRAIEIDDFIRLEQVDPVYFERSFYLTPGQGAGKAYALLQAALKNTGKAALARLVLRNKEYLAAVRPLGGALGITTMVFQDEIVNPETLGAPPATESRPDKKELQMAKALVVALAADFDPEKFRDPYSRKVRELLATTNVAARVAPPPAREDAKVVDIMKALEASLAAARNKTAGAGPRRRAAAKQNRPAGGR